MWYSKCKEEIPYTCLEIVGSDCWCNRPHLYGMKRFGYRIQYNLALELSISSIVLTLNHFLGRFFGA